MMQTIQTIDSSILLFIQNNIRGGALTPIMLFFTTIGNLGIVWLALGAVLMCFRRYRKMGFCVILCIALAWVVNDGVIKHIVCRPRPFTAVFGLQTLVTRPTSYSFPSGHSCSSFCAAAVLTRFRGSRLAPVFIVALLIALSRIYVGVHYPTDILTGAVIGTVCGALFSYLLLKYFDAPLSKILHTPKEA
ncbi:MAG: phosphatase PAP2 family protein [Oscillospiraceae bacterium]|nr:phosphatase PAP2 family protein [Oscillospiraceae bacterium]